MAQQKKNNNTDDLTTQKGSGTDNVFDGRAKFDEAGNKASGSAIAGTTSMDQPTSSGSATGTAAATARSFYDQAKETAGQAYEVVAEKAATKLDEQTTTLSDGLSTVAGTIRETGTKLSDPANDNPLASTAAKYSTTAADTIENVANYFQRKDPREMIRDVESFARRNPMVFIGAAFGLGLLAARFLKSTGPHSSYTDPNSLELGGSQRSLTGSTGSTAKNQTATKTSDFRDTAHGSQLGSTPSGTQTPGGRTGATSGQENMPIPKPEGH
jgi:ElaB/YqjD/DUF883 family membrane-anchored ribosome-binding protein